MQPTMQQHIDRSIDQLIAAIEDGHSEQLRQYLAVMGRFHRYSWANQLLIAVQRPGATRVAGYRAWQKLNRQVRKGERGLRILAPIIRRASGSDAKATDPAAGHDEDRVCGFRSVAVFDVSQTDGEPLPEFAAARGDAGDATYRLINWLNDVGVTVEDRPMPTGVRGSSAGGRIALAADLRGAERFAVLVHEAAHERLHQGPDADRSDLTTRELEAEAVAFVVAQGIGLDANTASSDYIQLYGGDRDKLIQRLHRIRRVAGELLEAARPPDTSTAADPAASKPRPAPEVKAA